MMSPLLFILLFYLLFFNISDVILIDYSWKGHLAVSISDLYIYITSSSLSLPPSLPMHLFNNLIYIIILYTLINLYTQQYTFIHVTIHSR